MNNQIENYNQCEDLKQLLVQEFNAKPIIAGFRGKNQDMNDFFRTLLETESDESKKEPLKQKLLQLRLPSLPLNKVEIRSSRIHGKGVFAKENIRKGEIITMYPGDILRYYFNKDKGSPPKGGSKCGIMVSSSVSDEMYREIMNNPLDGNLAKYMFDVNDCYNIIGHPDLISDPAYFGHMCNDGARSSSYADVQIYSNVCLLLNNSMYYNIIDCHVAIMAYKDIKINEEILVSYGLNYWKNYYKM